MTGAIAAKAKLEKKKMNIQASYQPRRGITAWLVEEHSVPLVALALCV